MGVNCAILNSFHRPGKVSCVPTYNCLLTHQGLRHSDLTVKKVAGPPPLESSGPISQLPPGMRDLYVSRSTFRLPEPSSLAVNHPCFRSRLSPHALEEDRFWFPRSRRAVQLIRSRGQRFGGEGQPSNFFGKDADGVTEFRLGCAVAVASAAEFSNTVALKRQCTTDFGPCRKPIHLHVAFHCSTPRELLWPWSRLVHFKTFTPVVRPRSIGRAR